MIFTPCGPATRYLVHDTGLKTCAGTRVWVWRVQVRVWRVFLRQIFYFNHRYLLLSLFSLFVPPPTMAPVQSKIARPVATQPEKKGSRKRKVSSRVMDENFVGAETNVVTKRLKLSANATRTAGSTAAKRQASVEDVEDDDNILINDSPKNPNALLEAVDGSDNDVDMDPAPALEDIEPDCDDDDDEDEDEEPEIIMPEETAEAELGESI